MLFLKKSVISNWLKLLITWARNETIKIFETNLIPCQYLSSNILTHVILKKHCQGSCWLNWFGDFSSAWWLQKVPKGRCKMDLDHWISNKGPILLLPRCLPPFLVVWFFFFPNIILKHGNCAFFRALLH